ncbi:hypothetical protein HNY73_015725 [Argiope bruennichi]|uniref:Uncharacterized protein n=1 Tax=Argiope bruennichi TaxID=94029 RepID=A0A8T0EGX1_ARGBR|nr:hypothetical protein HNY73_015725 [Argiope bruennichi]
MTTKPSEEKKGRHLRSALFHAGDSTDANSSRHHICERILRDVMFALRKGDFMHVRQLSDEDCRTVGPLGFFSLSGYVTLLRPVPVTISSLILFPPVSDSSFLFNSPRPALSYERLRQLLTFPIYYSGRATQEKRREVKCNKNSILARSLSGAKSSDQYAKSGTLLAMSAFRSRATAPAGVGARPFLAPVAGTSY